MKSLKLILTISLFLFSINAFSQNEDLKKDFLARIENKLKAIDSSTYISGSQISASKRKIEIAERIKSSKIFFKVKVKYYKNGLKREVIKLYTLNSNNIIYCSTKIIRINNNIFYVKNIESDDNNKTSTKELFFDNKSYQRIIFNEKNKIISSKTYICLTSDK